MTILYIPTRQDIEQLKTGDLAPDSFGRQARIVNSVYKAEDVNGKMFAHYYTEFGYNGSCSMSMKEGELVRHVGTSQYYTSHQLDVIESEMLANGERVREL